MKVTHELGVCSINQAKFDHVVNILSQYPDFDRWTIAGGAIRSLYDGTEIKDFDIYKNSVFSDKQNFASFLRKEGFEIVNCKGFSSVYTKDDIVLNIIDTGTRVDCFDFTCCQMEYHTRNGFHFYGNAIEDAKNKVLKANVILYPKSTIKRILKYVEKGYKVDRKLIKALWNSVLAGADDEFEY